MITRRRDGPHMLLLGLLAAGLNACVLTYDADFPNACGGQNLLDGTPGSVCGECEDGEWVCDGTEAVMCFGASTSCVPEPDERCDGNPVNACNGCATLDVDPSLDDPCPAGEIAYCVSPEEARCVPAAQNACGGDGVLSADRVDMRVETPLPGTPCGTCSTGYLACETNNSLICVDEAPRNACGGCNALTSNVGERCACGEWACSPTSPDGLVCTGHGRLNSCGGCSSLNETLGEPCGEDRVWVCDGTDATRCAARGTNPCGGDAILPGVPLTSCGPCADGIYVCAAPNVLACVDGSQPNACGGCGFELPFEVGAVCGPDHAWRCDFTSGTVECSTSDDRDNDGVFDELDVCPSVPDPDQSDRDGDGVGDACSDVDADGVLDTVDSCPQLANPDQADLDVDALGDACDGDIDGDDVTNRRDNCPRVANPDQRDTDRDSVGDNCDGDDDGDGIPDAVDNCSGRANADQADGDANGTGDVCEDRDGDGLLDASDNCPNSPNPEQGDLDRDARGDVCDDDADGDGVEWDTTRGACATEPAGCSDNCPLARNPDQADTDGDGRGDACDLDRDGDGQAAVASGGLDCDDSEPRAYEGALETCDGLDNDCDGFVDDEDPDVVVRSWYEDRDADGYGALSEEAPLSQCEAPAGYVETGGDCDDADETVFPGAPEICRDGLDNNCDGLDSCERFGSLLLSSADAVIRPHHGGQLAPIVDDIRWLADALLVSVHGEVTSGYSVWTPDTPGLYGPASARLDTGLRRFGATTAFVAQIDVIAAGIAPESVFEFVVPDGTAPRPLVYVAATSRDEANAGSGLFLADALAYDEWVIQDGNGALGEAGRTNTMESVVVLDGELFPKVFFSIEGPASFASDVPEGMGRVYELDEVLDSTIDGLDGPAYAAWESGEPLSVDDTDEYGATMEACDLNANGFDELIVGGPGADRDRGIVTFAPELPENPDGVYDSSAARTFGTAVIGARAGSALECVVGLRSSSPESLLISLPGYTPSTLGILHGDESYGADLDLSGGNLDDLFDARILVIEPGRRVADVDGGDFNGDGVGDVLVGLKYDATIEAGDPVALLFYGPIEGTLLSTGADVVIVSDRRFDGEWVDVAASGDVNGDAFDDVAVVVTRAEGTAPLFDVHTDVFVFYGVGQ